MTEASSSPLASRWPAALGRRALVMGVVNLTPDSFSDGGRIGDVEAAVEAALAMERDGAAIIDVGGESTHPKAAPIGADEEIARVLPGLAAIAAQAGVPVSIDTYKARTAAAALAAGATIVNDVWGLQRDPDMARVVGEHQAGLCIMHNRITVDPSIDIIQDIRGFFARSLDLAARAGVKASNIVLDPGIGFGKSFDQNLICLKRLAELTSFGLPLLVGCSRKGFIGAVTGRTVPADRLHGSLAAHVAAALNGAAIIRAHDVKPHVEALALTDAILRGSTEPAQGPP
jgi:dihydropteroate synthase